MGQTHWATPSQSFSLHLALGKESPSVLSAWGMRRGYFPDLPYLLDGAMPASQTSPDHSLSQSGEWDAYNGISQLLVLAHWPVGSQLPSPPSAGEALRKTLVFQRKPFMVTCNCAIVELNLGSLVCKCLMWGIPETALTLTERTTEEQWPNTRALPAGKAGFTLWILCWLI